MGGTDCQTGADADQRIGAHARTAADTSQFVSQAGYTLGAYAVASAFRGTCAYDIARLGVIVHEFLHPFGVPDGTCILFPLPVIKKSR